MVCEWRVILNDYLMFYRVYGTHQSQLVFKAPCTTRDANKIVESMKLTENESESQGKININTMKLILEAKAKLNNKFVQA